MLEFTRLDKDVLIIKDYLEKAEISFCDISLGTKFMWRDDFLIDYAVFNKTLIMKESCLDYKDAFYYPIGKDIDGALLKIEEYCKKTGTLLRFCCIDNKTAVKLCERYSNAEIFNDRNWSDYIYDAESFKSFIGKKYSGQRNHINKFKKTYQNYYFRELTKEDIEKVKVFLKEFESGEDFSAWSKKEEERKVLNFVQNLELLNQKAGAIFVKNKMVAFSVGEVVQDTLIIHVEKGLKSYEGVYPFMANEFAKAFAVDGVKFINREEDCGDMGLRISKLQYHPIEVKQKNIVTIHTAFDRIKFPIKIKTDRLTVSEIENTDTAYYDLCIDDELNKYYGYDYREDCKGIPSFDYFYSFVEELKKKKEEYSLAVRLNGKLIGEIVLWNFGFYNDLEIGFRFLKEYQNKGYAFESVKAVIDYLFETLKISVLTCRAYKNNIKSLKLINRLNFIKTKENDTHYFFNLKR